MKLRIFAITVWGAVAIPVVSVAATIYVDRQIAPSSCGNYSPATRTCGSGTAVAYKTLQGGAAAAIASDTVLIRGGTYGEQLAPPRSGSDGQPITFRSYAGETVTLSGLSVPALWLIGRSYIAIEGLNVTNVLGWGRLEDSTQNVIRNTAFSVATATGTTGGLKLVRATYNKIAGNTFTDGNDNIVIQESDRNVFVGNVVQLGRHSLLSLRCGNGNVIRGNTFSNPSQKDLEIFDCEGVSDAPFLLDATKRNVVEGNVIKDTAPSGANYRYNGIQFGGQQAIIRRNVFQDDQGGGVNFQYYADESLYNYENRVYHNTFYNNRCYAIVGNTGQVAQYYDNRARNNILYKNSDCSGAGGQTLVADPSRVILSDNQILVANPGFADENARDFRLVAASPMIDAAAYLTTTVDAGSGTSLPVADAFYFYDGYGIPGELGDIVQLQGQTQTARVVSVDLVTRRLLLDQPLTWSSGQGVSLEFAGNGPDYGAFEYGTDLIFRDGFEPGP